MFSFVIFEIERGEECFIGYCNTTHPPEWDDVMPLGTRVLINLKGEMSQFEDIVSAVWFTMAAITSVSLR